MFQKKSLGQHFLRSPRVLEDMCTAGSITSGDIVLEIGPGTGSLTKALLEKGATVVALEKDHRLIPELTEQFKEYISAKKFYLIETDVLLFDPENMHAYGNAYKIVANIPYYITGAIIEKFLSASFQPTCVTLLVQQEVAQRIIARNSKEGILSISVKCYGTPRLVKKVARGLFSPPPNVDSAILAIDSISKKLFAEIPEDQFFQIVKAGFAHKRKKLKNNLLAVYMAPYADETISAALEKAELTENTRAEDVTIEQWKQIATEMFTGGREQAMSQ